MKNLLVLQRATQTAMTEYCPSSEENTKCKQLELDGLEVELERRLFVCESTQLMDMVEQINASSKCSTPECSGE